MKKYHLLVIQPDNSYGCAYIEKRCYIKTFLNIYLIIHQFLLILFCIHPLITLPVILFYYK
uniref:Uncharacterized protein n=1 Tax=viral metagenome TaxID=1070528 RepID=A0A6C0AYM1_9ZZZZ